MLLRTHVACASLLAFALSPSSSVLPSSAACILGAWLPDVDTHLPSIRPANPFSGPIRHRGATHSLIFLALSSILTFFLFSRSPFVADAPLLACFFSLGFTSHIILDALTRSPVYPLWPLRVALHLPPLAHLRGIRTGGDADRALWVLFTLTALCFLLYRFLL